MAKKTNLKLMAVAVMVVLIGAGSVQAVEGDIFVDDFIGDNTRGRFVMEAENYSIRTPGDSTNWWEVNGGDYRFIEGPGSGNIAPTAKSGVRGNYMETLPPGASGAPIDVIYNGPTLDYKISIETPGTYRLYAKWSGRNGATDSIFATIIKPDGTLLTGAGPTYFVFHGRTNWIWDNRGVMNSTNISGAGFPHSAVWTISETGTYIIRMSQRESESALDTIVFQTSNISAPSGYGPPESQILTEPLELVSLEIVGPGEVAEDSQTQYRAIAIYDNNSTADVTDLADWSVEPNDIASITAGLLTTEMM